MRFAKVVRLGRTRTDVGIDLWNLFNTNYATAYEDDYGPRGQHVAEPDVDLRAAVRAPELHGELLSKKA